MEAGFYVHGGPMYVGALYMWHPLCVQVTVCL